MIKTSCIVIFSFICCNILLLNYSLSQDSAKFLSIECQVAYDHSDYGEAIRKCKEALAMARGANDKNRVASILSYLGHASRKLAQYEKAISFYDEALGISQKIGDNRKKNGEILTNTGIAYRYMGEYEKSLECYEQALAIDEDLRDESGKSRDLTNIANVYSMLGLHKRAIGKYEDALEIEENEKNKKGKAEILVNRGLLYENQENYDAAQADYKEAWQIFSHVDSLNGQGTALNNLGNLYSKCENYEGALNFYKYALEIFQQTNDRKNEAVILSNMGYIYSQLEHNSEAARCYKESLKIFEKIAIPESTWRAKSGLGKLKAKSEKSVHKEVIQYYEDAFEIIESMKEKLAGDESKSSFMQDKLNVYDELIQILNAWHEKHPSKGYDRKSFEIFERKQGRIFLNQMGKIDVRNFHDVPNNIIQKTLKLKDDLESATQKLADKLSEFPEKDNRESVIRLRERIGNVKQEEERHKQFIRVKYPEYYAVIYPEPVMLSELQENILREDEILMIYGVMKDMTCLWMITNEKFKIYSIKIQNRKLEDKIISLRDTLLKEIGGLIDQEPFFSTNKTFVKELNELTSKKISSEEYRELSKLLLPEELKPDIREKLLYIVPTSFLCSLPFEVLMTQTTKRNRPKYLIEDCAVTYLSSASLLKILRRENRQERGDDRHPFLAFADPIYKKDTPVKDSSLITKERGDAYREYYKNFEFPQLPASKEEAERINRFFSVSEKSDSLQLRENACRSKVFEFHRNDKLDDYQYVLFSCHGVLPDEVGPIVQPALVLSIPDPNQVHTGFLTMADVFGLKFNADIITLSACNTGRASNIIQGENMGGLTKSFMLAGTDTVSVTLWSVADRSTMELTTGLHENLKEEGMTRAEALRNVKCNMIEGELVGKVKCEEDEDCEINYHHPFFWAPMIIFGEGR